MTNQPEPKPPHDLDWIKFETRREIPPPGFVLAPAMFAIPILLLIYLLASGKL